MSGQNTHPPATGFEDWKRAHIDHDGRPFIDGHPVTVRVYEAFWSDCMSFLDGEAAVVLSKEEPE